MKLAVDGNLQIPGSIILTLKKHYKVEKRRERERNTMPLRVCSCIHVLANTPG